MTPLALVVAVLAQAPADPPDAGTPAAGFETVVRSTVPVDLGRVGGSAHVVTEGHLQRYERNDAHQVLREVPGVYVRDEDGYGLRPNIGLRGATSDRSSKVTLMEDGVLFAPAAYTAPAAYYFPLVTRLTGVEIYKGPASIRFGPQTIGGAVNLKTREVPDGSAGAVDLSVGAYRTGKVHAHAGHGGERLGVLLEGVHLQTRGFKELDVVGDTGFDKNELMLKAYGVPDVASRHRVEAKLGYADERSDETYLGLSDADFAAQPLRRYAATQSDRMQWRRTQAQLSHAARLGPVELRTVAYHQALVRAWTKVNGFRGGPGLYDVLRAPTGENAVSVAVLRGEEDTTTSDQALMLGTNDRRFVSQGVQSTAVAQVALGPLHNRLEVGVRFHHDQVERLHTENPMAMTSGVLVPEGTPTLTPVWNVAFTRALAAHLTDELTLGRLLLAPGVRVEVLHGELGDRLAGERTVHDAVVPLAGVGAVFQISRGVSVLAGAHQGFSPVTPGQPAEVRPERSVNYEAGARWKTRSLRLEGIGFFSDYANLTGECTFSTGCGETELNRQFNGGAVYVWGAELTGRAQRRGPLEGMWGLEVSYTFTGSSFRTSFASEAPQFGRVEAGDELPYVPQHQGSATLSLELPAWTFAVSAGLTSAMREVAGQGEPPVAERTDGRVLLDAAVHRRIGEDGRLYGTVTNLLDARYVAAHRPFGARPGAPRMFQVGYSHAFR